MTGNTITGNFQIRQEASIWPHFCGRPAKPLMAFLCMISLHTAQGQTGFFDTSRTWSAGVLLLQETNPVFYYQPEPSFLNGAMVKKSQWWGVIRAGVEIKSSSYTGGIPECCDQINSEGFTRNYILRAGVEKGVTLWNRVRPYTAADLAGIYRHSRIKSSGGIVPIDQLSVSNGYGLGLYHVLGLEIRLAGPFSVSFETRLCSEYIHTRTETTILSPNPEVFKSQTVDFDIKTNRLSGLYLHYLF